MPWYQVQIINEQVDDLDAIDATKFRLIMAKNPQEAAIEPLREAGAIERLVDEGHSVVFSYVAKPNGPKHTNGVPLFLERFELEISV